MSRANVNQPASNRDATVTSIDAVAAGFAIVVLSNQRDMTELYHLYYLHRSKMRGQM